MDTNEQRNGRSDFVRTWKDDKIFKNEEHRVGVKLTRSNDRFPLFRQELVEIAEDGRTYSRMKVMSTGHKTGDGIKVPDLSIIIPGLFDQAREYVLGVLQAAEDDWIAFTSRQNDHGGSKNPPRRVEKTQRDKERRQKKG